MVFHDVNGLHTHPGCAELPASLFSPAEGAEAQISLSSPSVITATVTLTETQFLAPTWAWHDRDVTCVILTGKTTQGETTYS